MITLANLLPVAKLRHGSRVAEPSRSRADYDLQQCYIHGRECTIADLLFPATPPSRNPYQPHTLEAEAWAEGRLHERRDWREASQ